MGKALVRGFHWTEKCKGDVGERLLWVPSPINQSMGACLTEIMKYTFKGGIMRYGGSGAAFGYFSDGITDIEAAGDIGEDDLADAGPICKTCGGFDGLGSSRVFGAF
jgi:hypothetical protein